jgi:hypothetical protein
MSATVSGTCPASGAAAGAETALLSAGAASPAALSGDASGVPFESGVPRQAYSAA